MNAKALWKLFHDTFTQWSEDEPFPVAAAFSYYTRFSLAPLSVIAIGVAGLAIGREAAQNEIIETVRS